MIIISKKKLYESLIQQKKLYNAYSYNCRLEPNKINLKTRKLYTIYIITEEKNKFYLRAVPGILIKKSKMQNLTNLHLLCLKRYNNISISFFKESPNIIIKYKI